MTPLTQLAPVINQFFCVAQLPITRTAIATETITCNFLFTKKPRITRGFFVPGDNAETRPAATRPES